MALTLHAGPCFLIVDTSGDIVPGREQGFYEEDTRFLSQQTLRIGEAELLPVSARNLGVDQSVHFLTNPALPSIPRGTLVVRRIHLVGQGLHMDIDIKNHGPGLVELELEVTFDADFADLFEVKRQIEVRAPAISALPSVSVALGKTALVLARSAGEEWSRRTEIRLSRKGDLDGRSARFSVKLEPGATFRLCQDVEPTLREVRTPTRRCGRETIPRLGTSWLEPKGVPTRSTTVCSDISALPRAFSRAIDDLESLRVEDPTEGSYLAAGLPWCSALFGRDSLIASYQAVPFLPDLASLALRSLARLQGTKTDRDVGEEPGKIPHENRSPGLAGSRRGVARYPSYSSVDATPLFVIALGEYVRWTGDLELVRVLAGNVDAAVAWLYSFGDANRDGFVDYHQARSFASGHQGWRDSADAVRFSDGRAAESPIALVEVQGYACEALRQAAALYTLLGRDPAETARLQARADTLERAIDSAFWSEERGFWHVAIDGGGRRVDALTSSPGHLLWARAARPERVERAAKTLLSAALFSGFGLRTTGAEEPSFSPVSYHSGSVWPHDTALIAAGLARYGRRKEAARLCQALIDASGGFENGRLPELFAGLPRAESGAPVALPTANAPQAWAAGAVLLVVRTLLGMEVSVPERHITVHPALPEGMNLLTARGMRIGGQEIGVVAERRGGRIEVQLEGVPADYTVETG